MSDRVAVSHEYPPDQLAWRVDPPNGAPSRWAADEPLNENVITDIQLTDDEHGHKEATGTLARNPRLPWTDLAAYSDISVYGPGVEEVWAGRLDKAPESDGDRMVISPAAVGYQTLLDDDTAVIGPGFIDGDLSKWAEMSVQRRLELEALSLRPSAFSVSLGSQGTGEATASIVMAASDFAPGTSEMGEQDYFGSGIDIAAVYGEFYGAGIPEDWSDRIYLGNNDQFTGAIAGTDVHGSPATFVSVETSIPGAKYAAIVSVYSGSAAGTFPSSRRWANLKVLGLHGLTLQGVFPNVGYTAKQMLGYAIPLHTDLVAEEEDLEDTGYIIQQAWYSDPSAMRPKVEDIAKYDLYDWFVFGGKRFQLRKPGTYGREWLAYAGPSGLFEVGLDSSRLWRSVTVSFQDVDGTTKTIGPEGSKATYLDNRLRIDDPEHPAVRANVARNDLLTLNTIARPENALEVGIRFLEEANKLSRSGSATLSGYAMDSRGIMRPVSQIRFGDRVRFPDASDPSPRIVKSRSYDHASRTVSVAVDAPGESLQALLDRIQADISALHLAS